MASIAGDTCYDMCVWWSVSSASCPCREDVEVVCVEGCFHECACVSSATGDVSWACYDGTLCDDVVIASLSSDSLR